MATEQQIKQLLEAILNNEIETVEQMLKENNSLIKLRSQRTGKTLLHFAAEAGHADIAADIAALILSANSALEPPIPGFIDVQDASGNTALHYAAMKGNFPVAELLVKASANTHLINADGKNAVDVYSPTNERIANNLNMWVLCYTPEVYFKNKNAAEQAGLAKRVTRRPGLIGVGGALEVAGVLSMAAIGFGLATLALTLAGVALLPVASIAVLIGAAVLTGVGIIGLGATLFAARRYNTEHTEIKDEDFYKVELSSSSTQATQDLGGPATAPTQKQKKDEIPLIKSSKVLAPEKATEQPANVSRSSAPGYTITDVEEGN